MMRFLIDTHVLIWCLNGDSALPSKWVKILDIAENIPVVSIVSLLEISIKMSLKKLEITNTLEQIHTYITSNGFEILSINLAHLNTLLTLPLPHHHKDPFDRLLIAQAFTENLSIISADRHFGSYPVDVIW